MVHVSRLTFCFAAPAVVATGATVVAAALNVGAGDAGATVAAATLGAGVGDARAEEAAVGAAGPADPHAARRPEPTIAPRVASPNWRMERRDRRTVRII